MNTLDDFYYQKITNSNTQEEKEINIQEQMEYWQNHNQGYIPEYVIPSGVIDICSFDFQNSLLNNNMSLGSGSLGYDIKTKKYLKNTVGRYGCLFICVFDVGNSINKYRYSGFEVYKVCDYSDNLRYFEESMDLKHEFTDLQSRLNFVPVDANMSINSIQNLIDDQTGGGEFQVSRYEGLEKNIIFSFVKNSKEPTMFLIGGVDGHFINIRGFSNKGRMIYHDPYIRNKQKIYNESDIKSIYVINRK